jgi:hypothetical protein
MPENFVDVVYISTFQASISNRKVNDPELETTSSSCRYLPPSINGENGYIVTVKVEK